MGCNVILVNGGDVYTFDNIVRAPIHHQWSTSPYLHSQESQVARSQIIHADERRRAKPDPDLGGCFCAAEPHRH